MRGQELVRAPFSSSVPAGGRSTFGGGPRPSSRAESSVVVWSSSNSPPPGKYPPPSHPTSHLRNRSEVKGGHGEESYPTPTSRTSHNTLTSRNSHRIPNLYTL
ncbi:hypothetical protein JAAARDRAFT_34464 [Jaapia argillacea MUCL 33604]|uniref:Uncharacterized protein n=1 Tax=Jaapia argillacea MUCL 33604 TaxID=933084 RepID=A0A067PUY2_9AGAM|nr:hypothetical protein JAAARDRAFT_34464 [Jaapia argillacea MUCL 33604]